MPSYKVTYTMTATGTIRVEDVENEDEAKDEVEVGGFSRSDLIYEISDTDWEVDILEVEEVKST